MMNTKIDLVWVLKWTHSHLIIWTPKNKTGLEDSFRVETAKFLGFSCWFHQMDPQELTCFRGFHHLGHSCRIFHGQRMEKNFWPFGLRHGVLFGFQRSFCTVPVECLKNRIYHDIPQTSSPKKNKRELRHGQ